MRYCSRGCYCVEIERMWSRCFRERSDGAERDDIYRKLASVLHGPRELVYYFWSVLPRHDGSLRRNQHELRPSSAREKHPNRNVFRNRHGGANLHGFYPRSWRNKRTSGTTTKLHDRREGTIMFTSNSSIYLKD